jgi:hypothetical protein
VVRQQCGAGSECQVTCRQGEFAINAFCSGGRAQLLTERAVSCGAQATTDIVAYCMAPSD